MVNSHYLTLASVSFSFFYMINYYFKDDHDNNDNDNEDIDSNKSNTISSYNKFDYEKQPSKKNKIITIDDNNSSDCLTESSELKSFDNHSKIIYEDKIPNCDDAIHWINVIDGIKYFDFTYINDNIYTKTKHYFNENSFIKCNCDNDCSDPEICPCARKNYLFSQKTKCYIRKGNTEDDTFKILNPDTLDDQPIFECHPDCKCNKYQCSNSCLNTPNLNLVNPIKHFIVQKYKKSYNGVNTDLKGNTGMMWGLMTMRLLPRYSFVIEYIGEIITRQEADRRGKKYDAIHFNYLFDLNKDIEVIKVNKLKDEVWISVDGKMEIRSLSQRSALETIFPLCIDGYKYGNLSRFINHSCSPNLKAIAIHIETRNILTPRIAFFAIRDIYPEEELTLDYNCSPLSENRDELVCLCGSFNCRGYVYKRSD